MTDADQPLDEIDDAILDRLAMAYTRVDPPPADLDERVRFAIALRDVDVVVARLREDELVGSGARSTERSRTITFDSDGLTVMVTVVVEPDGRRRLDGWLAPQGPRRQIAQAPLASTAPQGPRRVELRSGSRTRTVTADESGRFVLEGVPAGLAQLLVHGVGVAVVTPSMVL